MKRKNLILNFEVISIIFTIILGVILHFTFKWSNQNPIVGAFSAINESVWEHLKILFFPMFITAIIGTYYFQKENPNYLCSKVKGILLGLIFIVIFYYTYSGVLGAHIAIIDIGSFFIAVIIGEFYTYKSIQSNILCNNLFAIVILLVVGFCFIIFTFYPPDIGLFRDPSIDEINIID